MLRQLFSRSQLPQTLLISALQTNWFSLAASTRTNQKVMFRIYPKDSNRSTLYYFPLDQPIKEIEAVLSRDLGKDLRFATSSLGEKASHELKFCDGKYTLDQI